MDDTQKLTVERLMNAVAQKTNIVNPQVKYAFSDDKKERKGFIGQIVKVEISGGDKTVNVIVKYASTLEAFRELVNARQLFCREIRFYSEFAPLFQDLQEKYAAKEPFNKLATFYGAATVDKCEMLVLEDLISSGFNLYNSNKPLDDQHLKLILQEYAKFHAVSIAYKHYDLEGYKKLLKSTPSIFAMFEHSEGMNIMISACSNAIQFLEPGSDIHKAYSKFCDTVAKLWKNGEYDEYAVLCHGDNWCNNFMFKYENNSNKVSDVRFLDFQIASPASLVYDISYCLMANSPPEVLKNIDEYLRFYYDHLALRLKEMNCPAEEVFPYKVLEDQWRKYATHGLMMGVTTVKVATAAPEDTPDLANDYENFVNFQGSNIEMYKDRAVNIINYYFDNGFI